MRKKIWSGVLAAAVLPAVLGFAGCSQPADSGGEKDVFTTPPKYREMVSLPGGTVTGSDSNAYTVYDRGVFIGGRTVTLGAFKIARYEITYELWKEVYDWAVNSAGTNAYVFANPGVEGHGDDGTGRAGTEAGRKTRPVTEINWRDAVVWCNAYSEMSGKEPVYYTDSGYGAVLRASANDSGAGTAADGAAMKPGAAGYRLPTEAEWEYAARGADPNDGINWAYTHAGTDRAGLDDYAWYYDNSFRLGNSHADYGAHPVGTRLANSKGLFDMSGNVWEWCWDWYDRIEAGSETDPAGPPSGSFRVLRGGGWSLSAAGCAAAYRYIIDPGYSHVNLGFRVACP